MKINFLTVTLFAWGLLVMATTEAAELYRVDSRPNNWISRNGDNKKSHIDFRTGALYPANIHGKITIVDHIARSRQRQLKDNSQFTSFSTLPSLDDYYHGGHKITVDLDTLQKDISTGQLRNTKVHSTESITESLQSEMDAILGLSRKNKGKVTAFHRDLEKHLRAYYKMVRIEKRPAKECDTFFWNGVNALRFYYPEIFEGISEQDYKSYSYIFNGLRHARTDHEVLIEGTIPKKYYAMKKIEKYEATTLLVQTANCTLKSIGVSSCECNR